MNKMTVLRQTEIADASLTSAGQRKGADSGDPQLRVMPIASDAAARIGIWECQPGGWPIHERTDTEICYILSGRAALTDLGNGFIEEISQGDLVILPVGWTGRWDVLSPITKIYIIF